MIDYLHNIKCILKKHTVVYVHEWLLYGYETDVGRGKMGTCNDKKVYNLAKGELT